MRKRHKCIYTDGVYLCCAMIRSTDCDHFKPDGSPKYTCEHEKILSDLHGPHCTCKEVHLEIALEEL